MKKSLRVALVVAVLASLASIAMAEAAPGGGMPQPLPQVSSLSVAVAIIAAILGL